MYLTIICEHYCRLCVFYANVSLLDRLLITGKEGV